jgi:5'-nucleotidase/UDP-sugar diphosphatase
MTRPWILCLVVVLGMANAGWTLDFGRTSVPLDGLNVASQETNLGNFVADAVRVAAGAEIGLMHAMAFRANALIGEGPVDERALRNVLSAPTSKLTTLRLTPAQLKATMHRALSKYPESNTAFLQFAGMQVHFDKSKPTTMRVLGITVNKKPLDLGDSKTTLMVAMPRELALGAVGYLLVFTDEVTNTLETKEVTVLDAVAKAFATQGGTIKPIIDGRLREAGDK